MTKAAHLFQKLSEFLPVTAAELKNLSKEETGKILYSKGKDYIETRERSAPLASLLGTSAGAALGGLAAGTAITPFLKPKNFLQFRNPKETPLLLAALGLGAVGGGILGYTGANALADGTGKALEKAELRSYLANKLYPEHNSPGFKDWGKLKFE